MSDKRCIWEYEDTHGYYDTGCSNAFQFVYDEKEKAFKYCPYCGKEIQIK